MNKNDNIVMISKDIRVNEKHVRERLQDCGDIQIRRMRLGEERKVDCLMVYIEVATSNMMLEDSALGKMIGHFWEISPAQIQEFVEYNSLGIADVKKAMEPMYTTRPDLDRSGMGFAFMEAFMDQVEVESEVGVGTIVRMKKTIGQTQQPFA